MRRKRWAAVLVGTFLVVLTAQTALAAPTTQHASSTNASSGSETYHVSSALCAKLTAAYPQYANDPRLCLMTHKWTMSITNTGNAAVANTATSCPSGTSSFHDYYVAVLWFWQMDLDTSFEWQGTCGYPTLTFKSCYVEVEVDTTITNQSCYSYHYFSSSWQSTAAVYTGWVTTNVGGQTISSWESQRRECYSGSVGDCNWTSWDGK